MNDPQVFSTFLQNVANVTTPRVLLCITNYIDTFSTLLSLSDDDLDTFVSTTHTANSARGTNQKILITPEVILMLKAILFELKDRQKCGVLPTQAQLASLDAAQLNALRHARSTALSFQKNKKDSTSNATMTIPTLTNDNYDEFMAAFINLASRTIGVNELPLDYLLRQQTGNYNSPYPSREAKLKSCILLTGDNFRTDSEHLYSLLHQHIGTTGTGSNFIKNYEQSRNGYDCYRDIDSHFNNDTYKQNKASRANAALDKAIYVGEKRNFTIETYYNIMTKNFNLLASAGQTYVLNDSQKIQKFEKGIRDVNAIRYCVDSKKELDALPQADRTFDRFYNIFSSSMNKYLTMANANTNTYNLRSRGNPNSIIGATVTTPQSSLRGRGRGRGGRGRGRGHSRGGRGRHGNRNRHSGGGPLVNSYNSFAPVYGNFVAEAKVYPPSIYRNFTPQQRQSIEALKQQEGWINSTTPPPGFTIDQNSGKAIPSNAIISAIRTVNINAFNSAASGTGSIAPPSIIQIPPPPPIHPIPPPPPSRNTNNSTSQAGSSFGRSGQQQPPNNDSNASISMVSINGQSYSGKIFDQYGNPLN